MTTEELEALEVGCVRKHFFDSGAFSLWTRAAKYAKENNSSKWSFYHTDGHWDYLDAYAKFIKKYHYGIDYYANVDVIPNPKLTFRNQKYLEEEHGLNPIPVVHYKTNLKWLERYINRGHKIIGLGGLVGSSSQDVCRSWIDRCFNIVCDNPDRLPAVKIHGFGVTDYSLLLRYPFFAVDSTSWTKVAAYGNILVPHKRNGKFTFTEQPYLMPVSMDSPFRKKRNQHFLNFSSGAQRIVREWLDFIGIPEGKISKNGEVLEYGVVTRHTERRAACLIFFQHMQNSIPKYPFPFISQRRKGFGFL